MEHIFMHKKTRGKKGSEVFNSYQNQYISINVFHYGGNMVYHKVPFSVF